MLIDKLKNYTITLGSASPRRKQLLAELAIEFSIKTTQKEEKYPENLDGAEIAEFLAKQKAEVISKELTGNYLLITADTIVIQNNEILHKPKDKDEAQRILQNLSGKSHKVISGVCIKSAKKEVVFSSETEVTFNKLSEDEILYYIENFKPFDKAGSYGIQQWIGYIGIEKIKGSYNNVVGLPTAELYQKLKLFI
ncbi:MAG: septum formation inhibitor Maf [Cryomorphaceae bacterium BACL11 MAG-121128-bin16]|nr:MAG: septum formation inhibitor Maf [Cryomorphaceae bacterium BACL11 MAG-121128-bin16]